VEATVGKCSLYSNYFGAAFLFIWCRNGVPTLIFLALQLLHMTTSTNSVQMKAK